jgi:hypothetical protein
MQLRPLAGSSSALDSSPGLYGDSLNKKPCKAFVPINPLGFTKPNIYYRTRYGYPI